MYNSQRVFNSLPRITVGIRREDPQRIWERRVPLTPDAVYHLISQKNVNVQVEQCDRRVFPDREYRKAGATIVEPATLNAHIILGIKETPVNEVVPSSNPSPSLNPNPTHLMFSHTAKGQPYNTPLLAKFVKHSNDIVSEPFDPFDATFRPAFHRLIDYELLTTDGKRTVGFGWFAGVAGVLESLSAMAHFHLEIGIASPFLHTPRPHTHPTIESLRSALRSIGNRIAEEGTPPKLGPFVIGLTGNGNVSQGCLSMLEELPIEKVSAKDLHSLVTNKSTNLRKIYLVHALSQDYLLGLDGRPYDRDHYYTHPQSYRSIFCQTVAPYLTLLLNGTGWSPSFPRLMTNDQLTVALDRAKALGGARFTNIGDISCDVEGGLQFLTRATTLSSPFYTTRPHTLPSDLPSVQMMSVDILPASLPFDASKHFSSVFLPYLESLIKEYTGILERDEYTVALDRATIARNGKLVGKHGWLQEAVNTFYETSNDVLQKDEKEERNELQPAQQPAVLRKKKLLMLGSGMVAGPAVDEIAKRADVQLLVASNSLQELEKLVEEHLNVRYRLVDITDHDAVSGLIEASDVVISLLPANFHPRIAELCINAKKHLITASYVGADMDSLDARARNADVLLLNEIGLDPGIDHCSAISLVNKLRSEDREILSFTSFCGGLPAPDVPFGPLRYKFSWRPRSVLHAALINARFRLNKVTVDISSEDLLKRYLPDVPVTEDFALEGIANRNSLPYANMYNLGSPRTVLRGTLRYPGFADLMHSFRRLGMLETNKTVRLPHWTSFVQKCLALQYTDSIDPDKDPLSLISSIIPPERLEPLHRALEWLSLVPPVIAPASSIPMPALPSNKMAPIDIFAYLLAHRLRYKPQERDMVVLSHEVISRPRQWTKEGPELQQVNTSSLITYGTSRASAMARTVGFPVAIAALNVLDGKVGVRGVVRPDDPSVYEPVLRGLEEMGLGMEERVGVGDDTVEKRLIKSFLPSERDSWNRLS